MILDIACFLNEGPSLKRTRASREQDFERMEYPSLLRPKKREKKTHVLRLNALVAGLLRKSAEASLLEIPCFRIGHWDVCPTKALLWHRAAAQKLIYVATALMHMLALPQTIGNRRQNIEHKTSYGLPTIAPLLVVKGTPER